MHPQASFKILFWRFLWIEKINISKELWWCPTAAASPPQIHHLIKSAAEALSGVCMQTISNTNQCFFYWYKHQVWAPSLTPRQITHTVTVKYQPVVEWDLMWRGAHIQTRISPRFTSDLFWLTSSGFWLLVLRCAYCVSQSLLSSQSHLALKWHPGAVMLRERWQSIQKLKQGCIDTFWSVVHNCFGVSQRKKNMIRV